MKALTAQESEMIRNKDAAGAASLFTSDALLVMLAPKLAVKPGREAVQKHIQGLLEAGVTNLTMEAQQVEARGNDAAWAAGTYSLTIKEKILRATGSGCLSARVAHGKSLWKVSPARAP